MKVAVFITARTGSSRLPNKALLEIKGKSIIEHLIDWIKRAKNLDDIILCTTEKLEDNILVEIAKKNNIKYFQGSENDLIVRHLDAAKKFNIDFIINAEADTIFYETRYIDMIADMARKSSVYDVITTLELPNGVNIFGYKRESLQKVLVKSVETGWGEILKKNKNLNQGYVSIGKEYMTPARLTLDYPEDFEFFKAIYNEFDGYFELKDIVKKLEEKPELIEINIKSDEKYWANFAKKKLRFLIIGLGSMGKRRIRNLKAIGMKNIVGYDISESRRNEVNIKTYSILEEALQYEPNAIIISTPPDQHLLYQEYATNKRISFFTEASVVSIGLEDFIRYFKKKKIIGIPSSTMRFHPAIKKVKELVDTNRIGKPLTFTYHSGSYLPNWHPNDDSNEYYAYDRKQGAAKEIIPFELSWLTWIFGDIKSVKSYYKETMNWGIDDLYQILIEFKSGVIGHLLVDVISRKDFREIKILGSNGIIKWDWNDIRYDLIGDNPHGYIWCYNADTKIDTGIKIKLGEAEEGYNKNIIEEMYIDELNHFINCILNLAQPQYTLEDDLKILKILEKIEQNNYKNKNLMDIPGKWRYDW